MAGVTHYTLDSPLSPRQVKTQPVFNRPEGLFHDG